MTSSIRKSNFELLRLLAILFVVASHLFQLVPENSSYNSFVTVFSYSAFPGSWIGVNLFFILTGYFLIDSNRSQYKKLFSLLIQVYECFVISALVFLVAKYSGIANVSRFNIKKILGLFAKNCIYPLTSVNYWYVTTYFILMLLTPILNGFLRKFSNKSLIVFLIFSGVFWYLVSNVFSFRYAHIQRAVFFYSLGVYLKKSSKDKNFGLICIAYFLIALFLYFCSVMCYYKFMTIQNDSFRNEVIRKSLDVLNLGVFVPLICILFFRFFERLPVSFNKTINVLAGTTFSIYILHCNPLFQSVILDLIPLMNRYDSIYYPVMNLLGVILVTLICSLFDIARKVLHEKLLAEKISKLYESIRNFFMCSDGENECL